MKLLRSTPFRGLLVGLAVLPVVVFYAYFGRYAVNVPFQDDFDGVLGSLINLLDAKTAGEWLRALLAQDDEYRVSFVRLVVRAQYALTGEVDFRTLGWVGNGLLLGFLVLFFKTTRQLGLPAAYFVPVPFLLLTQIFYEGTFWGWIPCQYFAVLFWAFLTLYLLSRDRAGTFAAALGLAVLTTFTNANGLLVFGPGVLMLAYGGRWRWLAVWLLVFAGVTVLYFTGWELPHFRPKLADNLRAWPTMVSGFFVFLGAQFDLLPDAPLLRRAPLPALAGLALAGLTGALTWAVLRGTWFRLQNHRPPSGGRVSELLKNHRSAALFLLGGLLFIGLTAVILVVGRASLGLETMLLSRYKLNGALLACLGYLAGAALLNGRARQRWALAVGAVALGVWGWSYWRFTPEVAQYRREKLLDTFAWRNSRTIPTSPIYLTPGIHRSLDSLFENAIERGFYRFPTAFFDTIEPQLLAPLPPNLPAAPLPDTLRDTGEFMSASNDTFQAGPGLDDGAYLLLKSERETHLFATRPRRNGPRSLLRTGRLYAPGFASFAVLKPSLSPGTYRVGWLVMEGQRQRVGYTPQRVVVEKSLKTALMLAK